MKLEDQVCSLELAKKLKELGVKQNSLFRWVKSELNGKPIIVRNRHYRKTLAFAYSVAELGEILIEHGHNFFPYFCDQAEMKCYVFNFGPYPNYVSGQTDADFRAKMLIYLIENKLFNPTP